MKKSIYTIKSVLVLGLVLSSLNVSAGNEDRSGSAGASYLMVNPWARSSSLGDAGIASTKGLEATFTNIAGLASTEKTQIKFNYTNWMGSAGVTFNSAGIAQRIMVIFQLLLFQILKEISERFRHLQQFLILDMRNNFPLRFLGELTSKYYLKAYRI